MPIGGISFCFPWLLAERIQSHDVLRPIKCEQIHMVRDNEQ